MSLASPAPSDPPSRRAQGLVFVLCALLSSALGIGLYSSAGRDDIHITYWAARSLIEYGDYLNYSGERVEISSSLLHVLTLAAASRLSGLSLPALGGALGLLFSVLALFHTGRLASLLGGPSGLYAMGILATSSYWVYWSLGSLETTYAGWLAVCFVLTAHRFANSQTRWPASWGPVLLSLLGVCLVRPEGGAIVISTTFGALGYGLLLKWLSRDTARPANPIPIAPLGVLLAMSVGVTLALGALRLHYFGQWLPQPVYAKTDSLDFARLAQGWSYYQAHVVLSPSMLVLSAAGVASFGFWLVGGAVGKLTVPVSVVFALMYLVASGSFALLSG